LENNQRLKSKVFCSSIVEMITLRMTQKVREHVVNWNKETLSLEIPLIFFPALHNFVHGANVAHVRMPGMKSVILVIEYTASSEGV